MNVVIRTDASTTIGTGHVVRCLTLAEQLRGRGASVHFISRLHEGHLCDVIEQHGFPVYRLTHSAAEGVLETDRDYGRWLGASWQEDALQTSEIIAGLSIKPTWLVVDHYALGFHWEKQQRSLVERILVIDDLADRAHDCDLLLDQNLVEKMDVRYIGLLPDHCSVLLGPKNALLQAIYGELHDCIPPREGVIRRLLIFFGGVDAENITGMALRAVIDLGRPDILVDVVMGHSNSNKQLICEIAKGWPNIHLYENLPSLAPLMAQADLAIGGGGTTTWERLCFGLPSIVITVADNQKPMTDCLHRQGIVNWLGHAGSIKLEHLQQTLNVLAKNTLDADWSKRCCQCVDGKGTHRVATVMMLNSSSSLRARRAAISDETLLLEWANDPLTRQQGFSSQTITPAEHHHWFVSRLRDIDGCFLFIVESQDGIPVGQVRFEKVEKLLYEVHYSLAKYFRGRNIGKKMLATALNAFLMKHRGISIVACVKKGNLPSQKIFEYLSFKQQGNSKTPGTLMYLLEPPEDVCK